MLYYHPVFNHACVAQLAEQLTRNEQVAGSNPATSSKKETAFRRFLFLLNMSGFEVYAPLREKGEAGFHLDEGGCGGL